MRKFYSDAWMEAHLAGRITPDTPTIETIEPCPGHTGPSGRRMPCEWQPGTCPTCGGFRQYIVVDLAEDAANTQG